MKKGPNILKKILNRPRKDIAIAAVFLVVVLGLLLSAIWAYYEFKTTPPYVSDIKYPIRGIDVSAHNGEIDFKKVAAAGIDFVFIKVSEGADFNDRNFMRNYRNARAAGLKCGFYHYFRFDTDGIQQGMNFARTVGTRNPELGLVIDIEDEGNAKDVPIDLIIERLSAMVDYLNLLGFRITFYTNYDGYYDYIAKYFPGTTLWICRFREYPVNAEWTFWQYSHSGHVDGVPGKVDLDAFCGSKEEWEQFLKGALWPYTAPKKTQTDEQSEETNSGPSQELPKPKTQSIPKKASLEQETTFEEELQIDLPIDNEPSNDNRPPIETETPGNASSLDEREQNESQSSIDKQ